mmetsp:Transcript_21782/g.52671  ORF Transcript_21782/g.52671 Transcript_21782/m.52671 type:complete len:539 (+) Transcript_21782:202-1818(+)
MRKSPISNNGKASSRSNSAGAGAKNKQPIAVTASSSTNYHSLQSIVSSESRDSDDISRSGEMRFMEREQQYHYSSSSSGSVEECNPIARIRATRSSSLSSHQRRAIAAAAAMVPPPPPPPLMNKNHSSASSSSDDTHSKHLQTSSSSNSSTQQKKALLSLLNEMRALEQKLQQQSQEHSTERKALMDSMAQQGKYITQLEQSQKSIEKENDSLRKILKSVFTRLDRFATGCWKFSSASVKKMSEALHIQVHEWSKLYNIDTLNGLASRSEEEAMERTTMEKMQSMHLRIMELKVENHELKGKIKRVERSRKKRGTNSSSADGESIISGMDHSDEASHMSGITQMTATTSMTATTAKLIDAMSGFLTEHETNKQPNHVHDEPAKAQGASPKSKPRKKKVQIASPRSILKQSSKYDQRMNEQRVGTMLHPQQQHSLKPQQEPLDQTLHQVHQQQQRQRLDPQQQHQKLQQQVRPKPHPGLPKSPMRRQGRHNKGTNNLRRPSKKQPMGFADFGDFGTNEFVVTNENTMWPLSWGDEESEV